MNLRALSIFLMLVLVAPMLLSQHAESLTQSELVALRSHQTAEILEMRGEGGENASVAIMKAERHVLHRKTTAKVKDLLEGLKGTDTGGVNVLAFFLIGLGIVVLVVGTIVLLIILL